MTTLSPMEIARWNLARKLANAFMCPPVWLHSLVRMRLILLPLGTVPCSDLVPSGGQRKPSSSPVALGAVPGEMTLLALPGRSKIFGAARRYQ
jgi:hypothetical protein